MKSNKKHFMQFISPRCRFETLCGAVSLSLFDRRGTYGLTNDIIRFGTPEIEKITCKNCKKTVFKLMKPKSKTIGGLDGLLFLIWCQNMMYGFLRNAGIKSKHHLTTLEKLRILRD
jgi:hypothetical protein